MLTEIIKCGEIFRCGPGKFAFACLYCDKRFNNKIKTLEHIESHFYVELSDEKQPNDGKCKQRRYKAIKYDNQIDSKNPNPSIEIVKNENILHSDPEGGETSHFPVALSPLPSSLRKPETTECVQSEEMPIQEKSIPIILTSKPKRKRQQFSKWGPSNNKAIVECDICGNKMKKRSIIPHLKSHANLKEFICAICQRRYNTSTQLKKHQKTHSTSKKFSCDYCGWQFHDRTNLIRHIRKHTGEKPYKCKVCEKSFAQSNTVIVHMRSHTGEKPFKCQLCGKPFNAQNMLQRHMRRHANEKKFKCNSCERTFYSGTALRDHRRSQHTGERPYVCTVCKNSFSRRSAYRQHVILHTGEKPYKCRFCDLCFAQGAGRRSHERSAHKDVAHLISNSYKALGNDFPGEMWTNQNVKVEEIKTVSDEI